MNTNNYTVATKPVRLYLAGPMSSHPDLNFPLFNSEAARLRALGYEVINPAEINGGAEELVACAKMTLDEHLVHWRECMRKDIAVLMTCDGVALLPGHERSKGARIESQLALDLGMRVDMAFNFTAPLTAPATDWAAA